MITAILRDEPGTVYDAATRQATVTSTPCGVASPGVYSTKGQKSINRSPPIERQGGKEEERNYSWRHGMFVRC